MLLCLISIHATAQEILPTELLQIYKYWQMNVAGFDKNTYDYIQTVDKQWQLRMEPKKSEYGLDLIFGYHKDQVWYKDDECRLMLSYDRRDKSQKGIMYQFTDTDNWQRYNRQMLLMDAEKVGSGPNQGGQQTIYTVNDIAFSLCEYPPGVNGDDRCFSVSIFPNTP